MEMLREKNANLVSAFAREGRAASSHHKVLVTPQPFPPPPALGRNVAASQPPSLHFKGESLGYTDFKKLLLLICLKTSYQENHVNFPLKGVCVQYVYSTDSGRVFFQNMKRKVLLKSGMRRNTSGEAPGSTGALAGRVKGQRPQPLSPRSVTQQMEQVTVRLLVTEWHAGLTSPPQCPGRWWARPARPRAPQG